MKDPNEVCVVVQARLGSKRVPQKMARPFADTTLMDLCVKKLANSRYIPQKNIYASVYEKELVDIVSKYNINIYSRSKESANSEGTPMSLMYEWWDKLPYKYCVLVSACAPFLKTDTVENFYKNFLSSKREGSFGVLEKKNYFWDKDKKIITPLKEDVMNTKTADVVYEAAHCLYAGRLDTIGQGVWMGDFNDPDSIELFPMEEEESFDVDYEWQFDRAVLIYNSLRGKE